MELWVFLFTSHSELLSLITLVGLIFTASGRELQMLKLRVATVSKSHVYFISYRFPSCFTSVILIMPLTCLLSGHLFYSYVTGVAPILVCFCHLVGCDLGHGTKRLLQKCSSPSNVSSEYYYLFLIFCDAAEPNQKSRGVGLDLTL